MLLKEKKGKKIVSFSLNTELFDDEILEFDWLRVSKKAFHTLLFTEKIYWTYILFLALLNPLFSILTFTYD